MAIRWITRLCQVFRKRPAAGGKPLTTEEGAWETLGPSAIPYGDGWPAPRAMTLDDMSAYKV